jgi:hypothetical protein
MDVLKMFMEESWWYRFTTGRGWRFSLCGRTHTHTADSVCRMGWNDLISNVNAKKGLGNTYCTRILSKEEAGRLARAWPQLHATLTVNSTSGTTCEGLGSFTYLALFAVASLTGCCQFAPTWSRPCCSMWGMFEGAEKSLVNGGPQWR